MSEIQATYVASGQDDDMDDDGMIVADRRTPSLDSIVARQRKDLREHFDVVADAQRELADEMIRALRADAGARMAEVLATVEKRIASEARKRSLVAKAVYGTPYEAAELERIAKTSEPGEEPVLVVIPRPDRYGAQERRAWAIVDVSEQVWG